MMDAKLVCRNSACLNTHDKEVDPSKCAQLFLKLWVLLSKCLPTQSHLHTKALNRLARKYYTIPSAKRSETAGARARCGRAD